MAMSHESWAWHGQAQGSGVTCSKCKRADPVSMSVTFSAWLGACSKRQAC